jgi:hypothetical protein
MSAHVLPPLAVNSKSERKINSLPPLGFEPVIFGMLAHLSNHSTKSHPRYGESNPTRAKGNRGYLPCPSKQTRFRDCSGSSGLLGPYPEGLFPSVKSQLVGADVNVEQNFHVMSCYQNHVTHDCFLLERVLGFVVGVGDGTGRWFMIVPLA